jgi:phosphatidylserine/phosphatidylglycerophosphate/cardiolipin synthase-like enzyme
LPNISRGLLHTKLLVIDNASYIGSANLDIRSLFINKELMLRIDDAKTRRLFARPGRSMAAESEVQTPNCTARGSTGSIGCAGRSPICW